MVVGKYDRWLKDAEPWVQGEDWDPEEYFKWVGRLNEAKSQLDENFAKADKHLLDIASQLATNHQDSVMKKRTTYGGFQPTVAAKMISRYITAYHFFGRASFEEISDKNLVQRAQTHFVGLKIGILNIDIAHMLQCAADKVPLKDAVRDRLTTFVQIGKEGSAIDTEYEEDGFHTLTPLFVQLLNETRVDGGKVDLKQIPRIFTQLNEYRVPNLDAFADEKLEHVVKTLNTDERMRLWLRRRAEPMLRGQLSDDVNILGIQEIIESGDLDALVDQAEALEKKYCSWDSTIGPAVKAIKRLGRTSAGKDYEKLASYAKEHQKPIS